MKKSRNNGKLPVLAAVCFYVVAGSAACILLFLKGISFSNNANTVAALESSDRLSQEIFDKVSGIIPDSLLPSGAEQADIPETKTPETAPDAAETAEAGTKEAETNEPKTQENMPKDEAEVYYAFIAAHTKGRLHVRKSDSIEAGIIANLSPNASGYVLEKGPVWSLIQSGNVKGYVFNEYLEFREISKEEFQEKFPERFPTP